MSHRENSIAKAPMRLCSERSAVLSSNGDTKPCRSYGFGSQYQATYHQGSDEGRRCRSTPACSNAEGGGTKVGRSLTPEFDVLADIAYRLNKQGRANLLRPACFPGSPSEGRNSQCRVWRGEPWSIP